MNPTLPTPLLVLLFLLHVVLSSPALPLELVALLSLKASLLDPLSALHDWRVSSNNNNVYEYEQDHPPGWCSWSGVSCRRPGGEVVSLDLSGRNLSGSIPLQISHLTHLAHLNLSHNAFNGPFPPSLFLLESLRTLDLNHNSFNSTFPPGVSNLTLLSLLNCFSNSFTGALPDDLSGHTHVHLQTLNLGGSYFDGPIPPGYGAFPNLTFLHLAGNALVGSIPPELGRLAKLRRIEIGYNAGLSGEIPPELGNLSDLNYMDISSTNLSGPIPPVLGNLTMLDTLLLFSNRLSGPIPSTIFNNLKSLQILDFSVNQLTGEIPEGISSLKGLSVLNLQWNNLTGTIPSGIGDLTNLTILQLWNNSLTGPLPVNLGIGGNLVKLDVSTNSLSGPLPENLCKGNKLGKLMLFSNRFSEKLPSSLANCTTLNRVRAQDNLFSGAIPNGFGNLPNLTFLDLSGNSFTGLIPTDLADSLSLGTLNLSHCHFKSELPESIWRAPNLQILSASGSGIVGRLPDFEGCRSIYRIELEGNSLSGSIPWKIGHCEKLVSLKLAHNSLSGIIPPELSMLPMITDVDLSNNLLNGTIPANFDNCTTLEIFNVSYNLLTGPIPSSGALLANLAPSSFAGNAALCGQLIGKPCARDLQLSSPPQKQRTAGTAIVWITAAAFGIGLFVLLAGIRWFQGDASSSSSGKGKGVDDGAWKLIAFQRLNFTAEDVLECLAMSDKIIGMGSTGTVYRAEMPGGEMIAVKKLWGKNKAGQMGRRSARRGSSVLAEVDVLGSVRHRNIVRLLGCCNNRDTTMLLYEYMPNGSLDDLLHGGNKQLSADWLTRYNIALGVAHGICYLHHDCDPVIVHRDLKPSNILLDAHMDARVADFGLAKLIQSHESMSVIAGSYGYIAPEYAYTLQVDEKSDIYSYGVVLLEILTGKRSVEAEFGDGNSIVDWVRVKIKSTDGVDHILDKNAGALCTSVREEMILVLRLALLCTSQNPADRPSMRDVVSMLNEAMPQRKFPDGDGGGDGGNRDHVVEINYGGGESMGMSSSFEKQN